MTEVRQYRFWLIGLAVALVALYLLRGVLLPFVAGLGIAYFLDPLCDRLERWRLGRTLATTIVMIGFGIVVIAVVLLLVPLIQVQISRLLASLPDLVAGLQARFEPLLARAGGYLSPEQIADLKSSLAGRAGDAISWIGTALATLLTSGLALVNILSLIFITPVVAFYMLRDWDRLVAHVDGWLPRQHAAVIREQARLIDRTLAGYARGQATVCLLLGTFYAVGLSLVGLEFGLVVGLLAGILSFIPYVGTIVGFVTSMGLALLQFSDPLWIGLVFAIFVIGQAIEGNVLTPLLVGDRIGLHPVWVIFALLAGGALFGFVGVLLGLPVAAAVGVLARFGVARYLQSAYYQGQARPTIVLPGEPPERPPLD
ncbi:MAG: AI-2E family transporter [Dongiaceae bacterium]